MLGKNGREQVIPDIFRFHWPAKQGAEEGYHSQIKKDLHFYAISESLLQVNESVSNSSWDFMFRLAIRHKSGSEIFKIQIDNELKLLSFYYNVVCEEKNFMVFCITLKTNSFSIIDT